MLATTLVGPFLFVYATSTSEHQYSEGIITCGSICQDLIFKKSLCLSLGMNKP
jgi:hypothetical protein